MRFWSKATSLRRRPAGPRRRGRSPEEPRRRAGGSGPPRTPGPGRRRGRAVGRPGSGGARRGSWSFLARRSRRRHVGRGLLGYGSTRGRSCRRASRGAAGPSWPRSRSPGRSGCGSCPVFLSRPATWSRISSSSLYIWSMSAVVSRWSGGLAEPVDLVAPRSRVRISIGLPGGTAADGVLRDVAGHDRAHDHLEHAAEDDQADQEVSGSAGSRRRAARGRGARSRGRAGWGSESCISMASRLA